MIEAPNFFLIHRATMEDIGVTTRLILKCIDKKLVYVTSGNNATRPYLTRGMGVIMIPVANVKILIVSHIF